METIDSSIPSRTVSKPGSQIAQANFVYEDNTLPGWTTLGEPFLSEMASRFHFANAPTHLEDRIGLLKKLKSLDADDASTEMKLTRMEFNQGTYKKKDGGTHSIMDVSVSHDRVYCMLEGNTETAEKVIEEVGQLACDIAGIPWRGLQSKLIYAHYGTSSTEQLGVTGTDLLSAGMIRFVKEVLSKPEIASAMRPKQVSSASSQQEKLNVVVHPFDFQIKVRIADLATNDIDTHNVRLSIRKVQDHDAGIFIVQTELPSDDHQKVVQALKQFLSH